METKVVLLTCILALSLAQDSKWVWKSGNRRSEDHEGIRSDRGKPRYEVVEDGPPRPFRPSPSFDRPGRPIGVHQEPGFPDGHFPNRPSLGPLFVPNERPGFDVNRPPPPQRPGDESPGILTGPVPSWVREPPFKNYDRCKCAEKFNCNSPGISYGQCDVGKQYCCFVSKAQGNLGGPVPSRPIHSPENGVLVGPGGPVDFPAKPNRPYPKPPVLVGPGGPTGIIGRPPKGPYGDNIQQFRPSEVDVLVGPTRPHYGSGFRPSAGFGYGKSSSK